ncbi:MAG TPA: S28 family serine protease [Ignavibacteriaceae bacterium]|nr:S28 family serine protease [Ignavibacteriaceae bacterium]
MKTKISTLLLFLLILTSNVFSQNNETSNSELYLWLKSLPDIEVTAIKADNVFAEAYEIFITQPIDHNNPEGPKFKEQLFLSHVDKDKPMVIELDGYAVNNRTSELSRLLHCNQIMVEHRYFGESVPAPFDWKYLTIKQAADDHHKIIELFKQFYKGKWITTGISKGGSCAIFHRYFYPDDADVSIPYVGPLNTSIEDQRVYEWIKTVSTPDCREKVFNFQKLCFEKRDGLYPFFMKNAEDKKLTYNIVGAEKAYEYAVLEYSFAFWQWGRNNCSEIPNENSSLEEIWDHLLANGGVSYFSDDDIVEGYPFFYQCYTEFGYYAYETQQFKDYLKFADGHTPFFIPSGSNPIYNPKLLKDINWWAMNNAKNFIFIYGGNDPWTAPGVCLSGKTNSLKMVNPSGSHSTRIKNFSKDDKELIYSRLEQWLDIKIER